MMGDTPLDMIQYYLVFGVHRFPESPKDRLTFNPDSKHIVVAHNDNFFKVDFQAMLENNFIRQNIKNFHC
jgi:carnitine O-acetyltransferase